MWLQLNHLSASELEPAPSCQKEHGSRSKNGSRHLALGTFHVAATYMTSLVLRGLLVRPGAPHS